MEKYLLELGCKMANITLSVFFILFSLVIVAVVSSPVGEDFTEAYETDLQSLEACKVPLTGKDGVCINLETDIIRCPTLRKTLLDKNFTNIDEAICDEPNLNNLNETRVCCAVDEYIELFPLVDNEFKAHENFKLIPSLDECGKSFSSTTDRIIGGTAVLPGSHPWMARLGVVLPDEDFVRFPCSGSIINDRHILTAAHCFKQGKLIKIRLAETDEDVYEECIEVGMNTTICQEVEDHEPETIFIHPNYTGNVGSENDIALIRLKEPIRNLSSPFTRPVCLPFIDEFHLPDLENTAVSATGAKNLLSIQGWGKENNEDTVGTTQLREVYVPLRSNVFCRHVFQTANLEISDQQLCAGGNKDKGSCSGDSGSPLLLQSYTLDKKGGMRMFQIGVVSYGRSLCGAENSPVVYTRVRSFLQFLLDNIRE
ncbi:Venom serine protease Bi-VSP [Orchesella cincta]|uniref:Venom serine protease Bi-VSP n=1 Tax=Orchesella cincta TaxID=48709 RepID=A0A1D2MGX9_ORCCI|nr:Venom serine protease Bi-VSP [Orchesella cincta]